MRKTVTTTWRRGNQTLTPGTEVSIRGERGRFRFRQYVTTDAGVEWIDVWGGVGGREAFRSFRPTEVRAVHRVSKARPARYSRTAVAA